MKCSLAQRRGNAGGIRPLDVAAILSVLFVLAVLGVFGTGRYKERAVRLRCSANLSEIGRALKLYANENKDCLPDCSHATLRFFGPQWPWDLHTNLAAELAAKGATRTTFCCPANPDMGNDLHWNFCDQVGGSTRVVSYGMLFPGIRQVPRELWCATLAGNGKASPAQKELVFDATACNGEDYTKITGTYVDRSNHVRDKKPLGGNLLFLDQHVEWRDFDDMTVRFNTTGGVSWSF